MNHWIDCQGWKWLCLDWQNRLEINGWYYWLNGDWTACLSCWGNCHHHTDSRMVDKTVIDWNKTTQTLLLLGKTVLFKQTYACMNQQSYDHKQHFVLHWVHWNGYFWQNRLSNIGNIIELNHWWENACWQAANKITCYLLTLIDWNDWNTCGVILSVGNVLNQTSMCKNIDPNGRASLNTRH